MDDAGVTTSGICLILVVNVAALLSKENAVEGVEERSGYPYTAHT